MNPHWTNEIGSHCLFANKPKNAPGLFYFSFLFLMCHIVPMEITFMDNGGNIILIMWIHRLYEFTNMKSYSKFTYVNLHIWSRTDEFTYINLYMWICIGFFFLPWARLILLSQKSWEGALAKCIVDNQTSTGQYHDILINTTFSSSQYLLLFQNKSLFYNNL